MVRMLCVAPHPAQPLDLHHRQSCCPSSPPKDTRTSSSPPPLGCTSLSPALMTKTRGWRGSPAYPAAGRKGDPNPLARQDGEPTVPQRSCQMSTPLSTTTRSLPAGRGAAPCATPMRHGGTFFPLPEVTAVGRGDTSRQPSCHVPSAQPCAHSHPPSWGSGSSKGKVAELGYPSITLCTRASCAEFHRNSVD